MFDITESEDGRWLYYTRPRISKGIWRRAVAGGAQELVASTEQLVYRFWQVRGHVITFLAGHPRPGFVTLDLRTGKLRSVGPSPKQVLNGPRGMTAAPDGSAILFTEEDLTMGDIMMMEGLK
jgi:hypothetical protein